jgi:hypothetical protein
VRGIWDWERTPYALSSDHRYDACPSDDRGSNRPDIALIPESGIVEFGLAWTFSEWGAWGGVGLDGMPVTPRAISSRTIPESGHKYAHISLHFMLKIAYPTLF